MLPVAVVRTTPGTSDPAAAPWDPAPPVRQAWTLDGWPESWTEDLIAAGTIEASDARVLVFTFGAVELPKIGDVMTVAGITGTIVAIAPDPSGAVLGAQVWR